MMDDEPFSLTRRPASLRHPPRPAIYGFEFARPSDPVHFRCELRDFGDGRIEVAFFRSSEFLISRRFDTRQQAMAWAEDMREVYEKGWEH